MGGPDDDDHNSDSGVRATKLNVDYFKVFEFALVYAC